MELLRAEHHYLQKKQVRRVGSGEVVFRGYECIHLREQGRKEEWDCILYAEHDPPCMRVTTGYPFAGIL